jgi:small-conductance mechanosensitive channel
VESINVFCKLYNPAMGRYLRIPIENMIGLISRPFEHDEPWFPCQKGDWVAIEGKANAKVVSLSHEQVEVVELGGRKTVYQTADFLALSPANLSTNFFIRVPFGLSYDMQKEITTTVLEKLLAFIQKKFEENGFAEDCLSLSVDFLQAGASSLDVVVFANMIGDQAPAFNKLERAIARWCVDCCNENSWEIPFPQLTVHLPGNNS